MAVQNAENEVVWGGEGALKVMDGIFNNYFTANLLENIREK